MKKSSTETKEVTITKTTIHCDDCDKEIKRDMACSVARCELCGADLCDKCVAKEVSTMGDYREVYCKNCDEIKEEYHTEIEKHEDAIESINELIFKRCKVVRGYKNIQVSQKDIDPEIAIKLTPDFFKKLEQTGGLL